MQLKSLIYLVIKKSRPFCRFFYPRDVVSGVLATATCLGGWLAGWVFVTRLKTENLF